MKAKRSPDHRPVPVLGERRTGALKASQIRGAPAFPVQNLYPCHMTDGAVWAVDTRLLLSTGIMVAQDAWVTYVPEMIKRMRISSFMVCTHVDAYCEETKYELILRYVDKNEKPHEQFTMELCAGKDSDRFAFNVPLDHLDAEGWFNCALGVRLLSGPEQEDREILLRGAWLEIKG